MSKILVIAESGFGKTTSLLKDEEYEITGLNPEQTYIISATSKPLPGKGSNKLYPATKNVSLNTTLQDLQPFRRVITNNALVIAHIINLLGRTSIKVIVADDINYVMQDYYMEKALSTGWDTPKKIGYDFGKIFQAIENLPIDKHFVMLAHGEEYDKIDGRKGYRLKTTGRMVQEYITPEGKFDVVLIGRSNFDEQDKRVKKEFVTNDDGTYTTAKSHKIFDKLYITNDMGYVIEKIEEYYN